MNDTPHTRAQLAQEFLKNLVRFPSGILADDQFPAKQDQVAAAMADKPADLIEFAKTGAPPARLAIVGNGE